MGQNDYEVTTSYLDSVNEKYVVFPELIKINTVHDYMEIL